VVRLSSGERYAGSIGDRGATIGRPLIRALLTDAATACRQPGAISAPGGFLGDHAFVADRTIGAHEQIRIVIARQEEGVLSTGRRYEPATRTGGIVVAITTRFVQGRFDRDR